MVVERGANPTQGQEDITGWWFQRRGEKKKNLENRLKPTNYLPSKLPIKRASRGRRSFLVETRVPSRLVERVREVR